MWRAPVYMKKIYYEKEILFYSQCFICILIVYKSNMKCLCFKYDKFVNKL